MKIRKAAFLVLIAMMSLTSCNNTPLYIKDAFFPIDLLKEQLVMELPVPNGDLLYRDVYGFHSPRVYVNSNLPSENYAQEVLDYLKNQNFAFMYTVEDIYVHVGLIPAMEDSHIVKEFNSLNECYFDDSWYFIYGNNTQTYTNEDGTIFLKDEHVIRIKNESGIEKDDEESINFAYDYAIIIDQSPTNVIHVEDRYIN